jgi:lipoprotein NlpD
MSNTERRMAILAGALLALTACTATVVRTQGSTAAPPPRVSAPKYGATTKVERGETLYGIAFRNGLDARDLAAWNGIGPPYTIYPGQSLRLFPREGAPASDVIRPAPTPPTSTATTTASAHAPAAAPASSPATTAPKPSASTSPVATSSASALATAPVAAPIASNVKWHWPADGDLLNGFVAGEPTRQGIDITGDGGTPVKAAADGVVVYSGSGLVGYGELIIVKHNDAWLSAYGHNRARMVNEGAIVKAGQQIAVMGRTGAPRDMLHFEIRYNGKPVDPMIYLPHR